MKTSVGGVGSSAGGITHGSLDFEGGRIPMALATGRTAGPTLVVIGMQHATEFSGPGAVDRVLNDLPVERLTGTLMCLPIVNPLQFRQTPEEFREAWKDPSRNLNRQWPGDRSSANPLSRLAAFVWEEALSGAAAVLDLHCCRSVDPRFAACLDGHEASLSLATSLGLDAVDAQTPASYHGGQLVIAAAQRCDIPAVLIESHPSAFQVREAVDACSGAIFRAMVHLGMLPRWSAPRRQQAVPIFRRAEPSHALKTAKAGYLGVRRWSGDAARKGEAVAVVRSCETFEVLEEFVSPVDGAVGCVGHPEGQALVEAETVVATVKAVRFAS